MSEQRTGQENSVDDIITSRDVGLVEWELPVKFDLNNDLDEARMRKLLVDSPYVDVKNPAANIADDLFELAHPSLSSDEDARTEYAKDWMEDGNRKGNWFYFPWMNRVVHYPSEDDHWKLITSRNRDLLTDDEQEKLRLSTVAVFGLSVGSNVAERLAISGTGGTLITADMDVISPSNLNRLRASMNEVGDYKIDNMARRVSLINPYVKQVHMSEGVDADNLAEMLEQQSPDVLIDEVDSFLAKVAIRRQAKISGIPVLMASDVGDRSVLDVERYDSDPSTEPFMGRIDTDTIDRIANGSATPQEIQGAMISVVGPENISDRLMGSLMKMGRGELTGIPQLGRTADIGASLMEHAVQRILLGEQAESGRGYVDPNSLHTS